MQSSTEEAFNYAPYVILAGDINTDFLQLTNSQLHDCLTLFNLTNVIDEPTRITPECSNTNRFRFSNWASIINESSSVDEACEHFSSKFKEFCKACIPSRNVLIRGNDKPWFISEIRYNIHLRDRLRKLFLKSGRIADRLSYK